MGLVYSFLENVFQLKHRLLRFGLLSPQRWGLGVSFCAPRLNSTAVPPVYYKLVPFSSVFVLFCLLYNFSFCFRPALLSFLTPFCLPSSIPGLCHPFFFLNLVQLLHYALLFFFLLYPLACDSHIVRSLYAV